MANPTNPAAPTLTFIGDMSDTDLDALLGMDEWTDEDEAEAAAADSASYAAKAAKLETDEVALATLRAAADPDKNIDNDTIRAYGEAKPSEVGTVAAALLGDRGSRAEIAMDLGAKTFVLRSWM